MVSPDPDVGAHGDRASMGRGRALPGRGRVGYRDRDLADARSLDARASGHEPTIPNTDRSAEGGMGRGQGRFVGGRYETSAGAHRQTDLLEPLGGKKGGAGPVSPFVYPVTGERKQGDQSDEADGEHGEGGENLYERQPLLLRKERPHAH